MNKIVCKELNKVSKRINIDEYSFREYSDYFMQFDKKKLFIEQSDGEKQSFYSGLLTYLI